MQKIGFCDKYSLTQAVLDGTKTMTRRVEKGLETFEFDYEVHFAHSLEIINQYWDEEKNSLVIITPQGKMKVPTHYKLGEVVAVAQAYKDFLLFNHAVIENSKQTTAGTTKGYDNKLFVRPDLMPHQIQIIDINIERLQDISDEDCLKEGVIQQAHPFVKEAKDVYVCPNLEGYYTHPRGCFATLINRPGVGRKGLWESNPCVVVYQFKLVK